MVRLITNIIEVHLPCGWGHRWTLDIYIRVAAGRVHPIIQLVDSYSASGPLRILADSPTIRFEGPEATGLGDGNTVRYIPKVGLDWT